MARVDIDTSELRAVTKALSESADRVEREHRQIVSKGALNVKNQLRAEMGASTYFGAAASRITYTMSGNRSFSEAEIGPESGPGDPGSLAGLAYFGGSIGGGTVPDPRGALEAEIPAFERAMLDLVGDLL